MSTVVSYIGISKSPDVTVTQEDDGTYSAVITIIGLNPQRGASSEERAAGIYSLSPPTVNAETPKELVSKSIRACASAVASTQGENIAPAQLATTAFLVGHSLRDALREFTEDLI